MAKRIDILEEKFLNTIKTNNLITENEVVHKTSEHLESTEKELYEKIGTDVTSYHRKSVI